MNQSEYAKCIIRGLEFNKEYYTSFVIVYRIELAFKINVKVLYHYLILWLLHDEFTNRDFSFVLICA